MTDGCGSNQKTCFVAAIEEAEEGWGGEETPGISEDGERSR